LNSFSICLFEKKTQKGHSDIKIDDSKVSIHMYLSRIAKNCKYNFYVFLGDRGEKGIQKGYIKTNDQGKFNNTLVITKEKMCCNINSFKELSLVLLVSENKSDLDIYGFRSKEYDYNDILSKKEKSNEEYDLNEEYDNIINNRQEYWPFSEKIEGMRMVKIDEKIFKSIKFSCLKDCLIEYANNSLKFYDFLVLGRCSKGNKHVYVLGIPDKYNECQVISMANMGAKKFYPVDVKNSPQNGSLGFWMIFM